MPVRHDPWTWRATVFVGWISSQGRRWNHHDCPSGRSRPRDILTAKNLAIRFSEV